jgi:hypothetical protein
LHSLPPWPPLPKQQLPVPQSSGPSQAKLCVGQSASALHAIVAPVQQTWVVAHVVAPHDAPMPNDASVPVPGASIGNESLFGSGGASLVPPPLPSPPQATSRTISHRDMRPMMEDFAARV